MNQFDKSLLKKIILPDASSHKGMNGKLMVIGGSHLFHAAFLWSMTIATRIVDMVFCSSVSENNEIIQKEKEEFRGGIVVARADIEDYLQEADCILIGPGLMRAEIPIKNHELEIKNIADIEKIKDEGLQTKYLTQYLLKKYPQKKWVIDGGSLQMIVADLLPKKCVITPNRKEFQKLFGVIISEDTVKKAAEKYDIIIVAKGENDIIACKDACITIVGGNAGMTKGGTGDVLAGLIAGLACTNELWVSACVGSYLNKKAGDSLYEKVGYFFNAADLANEIPKIMKQELLDK